MGFCPDCRSEYVAGIEQCATCAVPLVEELAPEEPLAVVYSATDRLEANLVCETLAAEGLNASVLVRDDSAFPTHGAQSGYKVAVLHSAVDQARGIVKQAIEDKLLGGAGDVV